MSSDGLLVGHDGARRAVRSALAAGRLPHALLLTGELGIGKRRFASWIVQARWCEAEDGPCERCALCRRVAEGHHPDVVVVERNPPAERDPEGWGSQHEITVDQIRHGVLASLALHAVEGRGRAVIVDDADAMNEEAQNALLKALEEPPAGSLLVLVSSRSDRLLDTIRSRCQELRLASLDDEQVLEILGPDVAPLVALARGRPGCLALLASFDAQGLVAAFDALLVGEATAGHFATEAQRILDAAESEGDDVRWMALEVLQLRLRDLAVQAAGGAVDGPTGPLAAPQGLPPAEALRAAEAAVLEAGGDLARHLPASVAWLALADGVRTAGMGATGGPGPHP